MRKKITAIFIALALLLCSVGASAQSVNIDAFLLNVGFPQEIINEMSVPQKEMICEQLIGEQATFCGYAEKEFSLADDGTLIENGDVSLCGGSISSTDLTLSVTGTRVSSTSGNVYYKVFPAFKWHTHQEVSKDSFAMNMYPGWEARPDERNLRLHLLNNQGQQAQYVDLVPSQASSAGYVYTVPSDTGFMQTLYEGYAYFNIDKVSDTASPRISLSYVHDTSSGTNLSYSISIIGLDISISGTTDDIYTMADNFEVSGLGS